MSPLSRWLPVLVLVAAPVATLQGALHLLEISLPEKKLSSDEGTLGPSNAGTPVPTPAHSRAPSPAPAPGSDFKYTEGDFQRVTKLYVDSIVQAQTQLPIHQEGPRERPLKARFSDLYFGKSHMVNLNTSNLFCSSPMLTGPQRSPL